jgi:hypothetical protein
MDPIVLAPLLFLLLFPILWCLIGLLLATLSGWRGLAARFPDREVSSGTRLTAVSGSVGFVNFRHVMALSVDARGVRFAMWLPVFFGFKPFHLAWSDIASMQEVKRLFRRELELKPREGATIRIAGDAIAAIQAAARGEVRNTAEGASHSGRRIAIAIVISASLVVVGAAVAVYATSR